MSQVFNLGPTAGGNLGSALGTGIANSLSQLAQHKVGQYQQRHQAQGLGALFKPEQANDLSKLSPELLKGVVNEAAKAQHRNLTTAPGLQAIIPGLTAEDANKISHMTPGIQLEFYRNFLKNPSIQEDPEKELAIEDRIQQILNPEQEVQRSPSEQIKQQATPEINPKMKAAQELLASQKAAIPVKKLTIAEKAIEAKKVKDIKVEQHGIEKENKDFTENLNRSHKAIREGKARLNRIKNLTEKSAQAEAYGSMNVAPTLGRPLVNSILKAVTTGIMGHGIDLTSLMTADAQELDKLSTDFAKNAKDFFPGRILESEFSSFMKTIPSLSQTNEGRIRVVNNMETLMDMQEVLYINAELLKQSNGGKEPKNFEELVEKISREELTNLSKKFSEGVESGLPKKPALGKAAESFGLSY